MVIVAAFISKMAGVDVTAKYVKKDSSVRVVFGVIGIEAERVLCYITQVDRLSHDSKKLDTDLHRKGKDEHGFFIFICANRWPISAAINLNI